MNKRTPPTHPMAEKAKGSERRPTPQRMLKALNRVCPNVLVPRAGGCRKSAREVLEQ
jgi:hypothetical protein